MSVFSYCTEKQEGNMRKISLLVLLTPLLLMSNETKLPFKKVQIEYNNGASYKVTYMKDKLKWVGLEGEDKGKSQVNSFSFQRQGDYKYIIRWIEEGNIVVHSEINLISNKVVSSIFIPNADYRKSYFYPFLIGNFEILDGGSNMCKK